MWNELSKDLSAGAAKAAAGLVYVGSDEVAGRTGLVWAEGLVVTIARQARDGEAVPVSGADGDLDATVKAWDARTGLALLAVPGVKAPAWKLAPVPAVGSLVLTVARPSPQGTEARLDLVRFVGADADWARGVKLGHLVQTDGGSFPGFTGAAVVEADGGLVGLVVNNQPGNGGFVVPAADLKAAVDRLDAEGSPKPAWLGVSTRPAGGQGLALAAVDAGSPADRAGWQAGDLLVSLAGRALASPEDLVTTLAGLKAGEAAQARLLRSGEVLDRPVTPEARPGHGR